MDAYRKHKSQIGFSVPRTKTPGGGADAPSRWLQPHQPTSCPPILLHSCTPALQGPDRWKGMQRSAYIRNTMHLALRDIRLLMPWA